VDADPRSYRIDEAARYVRAWAETVSKRWDLLRSKVRGVGFLLSKNLNLEVRDFGKVEVTPLGGQDFGVYVRTPAGLRLIEEAILDFAFDLSRLEVVKSEVEKALEDIEKRAEVKLEQLPKVMESFGVDAAENTMKLEADERK